MADIGTQGRYQGEVSDEGMQNWRGDQVAAPQGGQSIYKSSTYPLTDLGSRKVVGDRVFRYAKSKGIAIAGSTMQYGAETLVGLPSGGTANAAGGRTLGFPCATDIAANTYAEGYIICRKGATDSNLGMAYRVKGNSIGSSGAAVATCVLTLYDALKFRCEATSTWSMHQNMYLDVATSTANAMAAGVTPIVLASSEYFWLQTWGPAAVLGTWAAGDGIINSVSGKATVIAASGGQIGIGLGVGSAAAESGLVYLTIAP